MAKEMLINTVDERECRIAIVADGKLEELYTERVSHASRVGNIYKGRITNVEPSIQAAFVDFGASKNGFLHISDVHPQFFVKGSKGTEAVGRKRGHRDRPPIQECLRRGQEIVVQMTKEGIGTKGPTMTTYLSIPGRLLVMMPGMSKLGVSRKIEDEEARDKIKQMLGDITLPPDVGVIVRTAGIDRSKRDLQRDLNYLLRLWKTVSERIDSSRAPAEIYQESDLVARTIRDVYNSDINRIICDSADVAAQVREFLEVAMPRTRHTLEVYAGKQGLFHDYGLESEIEKIYSRRVELNSGGSLVIDQAEALVAIDVNSGRFRDHNDAEATALNINLEAAREIARQLRLRDLGGVIIIDFVDMREESHRRAVEKALREAVKPDRAKTKVLKISAFGIVEMTRQRVRPSLKDSIHIKCPNCQGMGMVKSPESLALAVMRDIIRAGNHDDVETITVTISPDVANHLLNEQRSRLYNLETTCGKTITVIGDDKLAGDEFHVVCYNNRHTEVAWDKEVSGNDKPKAPLTVPADKLIAQAQKRRATGNAPQSKVIPDTPAKADAPTPAKKRRRRRSKSKITAAKSGEAEQLLNTDQKSSPAGDEKDAKPPANAGKNQPDTDARPNTQDGGESFSVEQAEAPKKRRTRRGGKRHRRKTTTQPAEGSTQSDDKPSANSINDRNNKPTQVENSSSNPQPVIEEPIPAPPIPLPNPYKSRLGDPLENAPLLAGHDDEDTLWDDE